MASFSKFQESILEGLKRILKVEEFGVKTADECAPFGIDSSPIKGMTAIYQETTNNSESVIIGYINENQIAESGETRFYSMDANKTVKAFVFLKANGNIELNGNTHSGVRYAPLNSGIQATDTAINIELGKIATAIGLLGGSYVPAPIITDISASENNTIKMS